MTGVLDGFRQLSLRWKIVIIIVGILAVSLSLIGAGLVVRERQDFEQQMEQRLILLADVVGLNSTAALAFNDPAAAGETLSALQSDANMLAGALYDTNGRLFAQYRRPGVDAPIPSTRPAIDRMVFSDDTVALARVVQLQNRSIGSVYLLSSANLWRERLWGYVSVIGILMVAVFTLGLFVSIWLQRLVTEPVVELAQLMRRIGNERNYTLRAAAGGGGELDTLAEGFNGMLDEVERGRAEIEHGREELHKLNEELEQRVHDRTAQLEDANRELEAFSYSVSHDLRAPLRSIDGFSQILLEDHVKALNEDGRDCLDRVRRSAQRMGHLIDDLLKLARVTRTEPNFADTDLSALAREVADALQTQHPDRRDVEFVIASNLRTTGDARLIRIILENLFGNAWKFTGKRTHARIEFGVNHEGDMPVYFVRDNGAGFEMKYATKLFAPFQRLHTAEEFPGTGIGLATVQRIIRKHGGQIRAEAVPELGAVFYFTLAPVDADAPRAQQAVQGGN